MKYELDVLAALTQLQQPTTQNIVAATGISERKVQNVIKSLESDLSVVVKPIKKGRSIYYSITSWGMFESGVSLKKSLICRPLGKGSSLNSRKSDYYDSVKMNNYKESARLEGISIDTTDHSPAKESTSIQKSILVEKYSKYRAMTSGG